MESLYVWMKIIGEYTTSLGLKKKQNDVQDPVASALPSVDPECSKG